MRQSKRDYRPAHELSMQDIAAMDRFGAFLLTAIVAAVFVAAIFHVGFHDANGKKVEVSSQQSAKIL